MKKKKRLKALTQMSDSLNQVALSLETELPELRNYSRLNKDKIGEVAIYCGQIHTEIIRLSKVQTRIAQALENIAKSLESE
ncbi:MAG: hypothetical protein WBA77_11835 [Microcoleaceae cyanobacterium]